MKREDGATVSNILESISEYRQRDPNAPMLFDDIHTKGITYAQLDDMSARVYGWLKAQGIGREDFVLINLPRGVLPVIAMVGIWKAGAAWALVEDTYAPERIAFIREDCGCRLEINADNWEDLMRAEPLQGFEPADDHDAAYAIYTSGTTGNPKGVLHERGNLERAIQSITLDGKNIFSDEERLAILSPLNFVATVIVILCGLHTFHSRSYIVSYGTIKNTTSLAKFFMVNRINVTFLTPSYVRMLGNRKTPFLKKLFVGSEPANNTYVDGVNLYNIYATSETGFAVGLFQIDRAYDACPVGRPQLPARIELLGEDGQAVPDGEIGELCCEDPFVRGYIHLPEASEKAFVNGMFHSGDLARRLPDGNYVIMGRRDDMIKINGNRIEPAEIEAAVKDVLKIDWAAAKGFEEKDRSYLCVYYTANVQVDADRMREALSQRLPGYMIPSYYIKIDEAPLKANGKLDRKALPAPKTEAYRADYAAPTNETEEKLCAAMAQVLKLERVGINDDFYVLGGDSLSAIQMISLCDLQGLSTSEVFRGRTPQRIAALFEQLRADDDGVSPDEKNAQAMLEPHPLTTEQRYMINYQFITPDSTMYNLYTVFRVDKDVLDLRLLAEAIDKAVHSHPALLTTLSFDENGDIVQRYTPECARELYVEKMTDWEFHHAMKDTLVQPFKIIGGTLYRCRLFETEKAGYVFFDVHHIVSDGTSMKVFMADVFKAFMGMPPEKDYYYYMLKRREEAVYTDFYEESRRYFERRYTGEGWALHPRVDFPHKGNEIGYTECALGIGQDEMTAAEQAWAVSRNEFFTTAAALAIAIYNNQPDVKISWIFNGRETAQAMSTVGLLFRDLPFVCHFNNHDTMRQVLATAHEQVEQAITYSVYPYVEINARQGVTSGEMTCVLYQQDIRDVRMEGFDIESIDVRQNQPAAENIMDIQILDGEEGLQLVIDFSMSRYRQLSIERFKHLYVRLVQAMVKHCDQPDITVAEVRRLLPDWNALNAIRGKILRRR